MQNAARFFFTTPLTAVFSAALAMGCAAGEVPPETSRETPAPVDFAPAPVCDIMSRTGREAPPLPVASAPETPCPEGMKHIKGDYCPDLEERCKTWLHGESGKKFDACEEYHAPTRCLSEEKVPMDFCMDTYEYSSDPVTKKPETVISLRDLNRICQDQGKRLCTDVEMTQACRGPEDLPYPYGYKRDNTKCHIDGPMPVWDQALVEKKDPAHLAKIDRSRPVDANPECVSGYGVVNTTGNVDEITIHPENQPPWQLYLKGGHWMGSVRGRCGPATTKHDNDYKLHVIGGRCCADPKKGGMKR